MRSYRIASVAVAFFLAIPAISHSEILNLTLTGSITAANGNATSAFGGVSLAGLAEEPITSTVTLDTSKYTFLNNSTSTFDGGSMTLTQSQWVSTTPMNLNQDIYPGTVNLNFNGSENSDPQPYIILQTISSASGTTYFFEFLTAADPTDASYIFTSAINPLFSNILDLNSIDLPLGSTGVGQDYFFSAPDTLSGSLTFSATDGGVLPPPPPPPPPSGIPEPETWALMLSGLAAVGAFLRLGQTRFAPQGRMR